MIKKARVLTVRRYDVRTGAYACTRHTIQFNLDNNETSNSESSPIHLIQFLRSLRTAKKRLRAQYFVSNGVADYALHFSLRLTTEWEDECVCAIVRWIQSCVLNHIFLLTILLNKTIFGCLRLSFVRCKLRRRCVIVWRDKQIVDDVNWEEERRKKND